jgi:hypothetical protein
MIVTMLYSILFECSFVSQIIQLLCCRKRMMLHVHDADIVKSYEHKLTKKYAYLCFVNCWQ